VVLFRLINAKQLLRRPAQTGLCLLGIGLGVGVVVSVDMANTGAVSALRAAVDSVAGRATHQITAADGGTVSEEILSQVLAHPGVQAAAPVVDGYITLDRLPGTPLLVLGVDPFLEAPFRSLVSDGTPDSAGRQSVSELLASPNAVLMPRSLAQRLNLTSGEVVWATAGARRVSVRIAGIYRPDSSESGAGHPLVMDIAAAQELFERTSGLQRIDLIATDEAAASLRAVLGPAQIVERSERRTGRLEDMIRSFRLNLMALSLLALLVGAFLIYNTLTFSVVQRRRQIGILRSLGVTRGQVALMFLLEAAVLGAAGSALGLALGVALSHYTLGAVAGTISSLFSPVSVGDPTLAWPSVFKAVTLGVTTSLVAAAVPAWEAARIEPRSALGRATIEERLVGWAPGFAAAGAVMLGASGLLAWLPVASLWPGFASAFGIAVGFALVTPALTLVLVRALSVIAAVLPGAVALLGIRNIAASFSRTAPAIAALMVSLAMVMGVGLMVRSFRMSLVDWIDATIRADVYVSPVGNVAGRGDAVLPREVIEAVRALPGVEAVDTLRRRSVIIGGQRVNVLSVDYAVVSQRTRYLFTAGSREDALRRLLPSDAVLVSETFSRRTGLGLGDAVALDTAKGSVMFEIAGVYRDYTTDGGVVMMDRSAYARWWGDHDLNSMAAYLRPGVDAEGAAESLRSALGGNYQLIIRSNASLRAEILRVFDRTFRVTSVLRFLTMFIAVVGILAALLSLLLERTRELATLRSLGMTMPQLRGMLFAESATMGFVAAAVGTAAGIALAYVLVSVINVRSFGWTIDFRLSASVIAAAWFMALASALIATVYPAWRLGRMSLATAMRED
jgi:putative ABC transport system permease protein